MNKFEVGDEVKVINPHSVHYLWDGKIEKILQQTKFYYNYGVSLDRLKETIVTKCYYSYDLRLVKYRETVVTFHEDDLILKSKC
jgi:hypothetical protein